MLILCYPTLVEDHKELIAHVAVDGVRFALLIAEQGLEQGCELVDVQRVVPERIDFIVGS